MVLLEQRAGNRDVCFFSSSPDFFLRELSKARCFDTPVWTQVMALPSLEPVGHVHLPLTFGSLWKTSTHGELLNQCVFGHIWSLPCIFLGGFSLPCSDGCRRLCICAAGAGRGSAGAVPVFGGTPGGCSRDRHWAGQDISPSAQAPRRMQLRLGQWVMRLEHPQGHPEPPNAWGVLETLAVPLCERSIVIPRK